MTTQLSFIEFRLLLKKANLSIKEFATICGLNPNSISSNWKRKDKVPKWVKPFLLNYIKAQKIDEIKNFVLFTEVREMKKPTKKRKK